MKNQGNRREPIRDGLAQARDLYHIDYGMERLKAPAFAVWSSMLTLRFEGLPVVVASVRRLAQASGSATRNTVRRALAELEAKGYVQRLSPPADDRRVPAYFLFESPQRPAPVEPGAQPAPATIDYLGLSMEELNALVQEALADPAVAPLLQDLGRESGSPLSSDLVPGESQTCSPEDPDLIPRGPRPAPERSQTCSPEEPDLILSGTGVNDSNV